MESHVGQLGDETARLRGKEGEEETSKSITITIRIRIRMRRIRITIRIRLRIRIKNPQNWGKVFICAQNGSTTSANNNRTHISEYICMGTWCGE
jgi:hypothetical protein